MLRHDERIDHEIIVCTAAVVNRFLNLQYAVRAYIFEEQHCVLDCCVNQCVLSVCLNVQSMLQSEAVAGYTPATNLASLNVS